MNAGSLSDDRPPSASRVYDSILHVISLLHTRSTADRPRGKLKVFVVCLYLLLKAASSGVSATASCASVLSERTDRLC